MGEEFVGVLHEARPTRGFGALEIDGQRSFQLPTLGSHGLAMDMDLPPSALADILGTALYGGLFTPVARFRAVDPRPSVSPYLTTHSLKGS